MNRYVLKINDSTFVSHLNWIAIEIPDIETSKFEDAILITDAYLNYIVRKNGYGEGVTRREVLAQYFPHMKIVKVKIILDE